MRKILLVISAALLLSFTYSSCIESPTKINSQAIDCEFFKTGKFLYHSEYSNEYAIVTRDDTSQTELNKLTGEITKWKIAWKNKCEYTLKFIESSTKKIDSSFTWFYLKTIETKIIETTKEYYIFEAESIGVSPQLKIKDTLRLIN